MPVLVVAPTESFGTALCEAFLATGGQVRAYVHELEHAGLLRALGVHVAIGGPLDVERLEAACAQVHTVVHIAGPWSGRHPRDEEEAFEVTSISAHAASVQRVVVGVPESGKALQAVRRGLDLHGLGKDFELVECTLAGSQAESIAALTAADMRE